MSAPDLNQVTLTADGTAETLLDDGLKFAQGLIDAYRLDRMPVAQAILIVGFALVKQREAHYEEQRLAPQDPSTADAPALLHDYGWLKSLYMKACPGVSDERFQEDMARIRRITGV